MEKKLFEEPTMIQKVNIGRFTIVEARQETIKAVGIARRGQGDPENKERAAQIAFGRAVKALTKKQKNLKINHPLMG